MTNSQRKRRGCQVHAITPAGAKIEASHKLRVTPSRLVVVEFQADLPSLGVA